MLVDALADVLANSGCVENFWGKLDAGEDAALGVVSSARPFFVSARFARNPQPTLVVVPGEDGVYAFVVNGNGKSDLPYNEANYEQQYFQFVNPSFDAMLRGGDKLKNMNYKFEGGE